MLNDQDCGRPGYSNFFFNPVEPLAFKIGVQNSLELLMCSIDEKTRGIQIILANNLSLPKYKMEKWIRKLEFEILFILIYLMSVRIYLMKIRHMKHLLIV